MTSSTNSLSFLFPLLLPPIPSHLHLHWTQIVPSRDIDVESPDVSRDWVTEDDDEDDDDDMMTSLQIMLYWLRYKRLPGRAI